MSEYKNRLTKFLIEKEGFDRVARHGKGEFYEDGTPIYTIGHGTIRYPDGSRVKEGDTLPSGTEGKNIARGYLRNFINNDVEQVTNEIDNFNKLPVSLKVALGGAYLAIILFTSPSNSFIFVLKSLNIALIPISLESKTLNLLLP